MKPACKGRFFFLSRLSANQVGQPSEGEGRGKFAVSESLERGFQFCLTGYQEHGRKEEPKHDPKQEPRRDGKRTSGNGGYTIPVQMS